MPGGDRTGPLGAGARTGRGLGFCSGYSQPGFGFGFGFGRGAGRGWRHRFFAAGVPGGVAPTPEQETADLKSQVDWLTSQLEAIQKRLEQLK